MKNLLLTLACLIAAPVLANEEQDEPMVAVRAKILSVTPLMSAHGKSLVQVQLKACGDVKCAGQVKIAMPTGDHNLKPNMQIVVLLTRPSAVRLSEFRKGGAMESMALVADAPPMLNSADLADSVASR